uniref:Uncharacterized protein n=1 Tax=Glossina brevipalpis TaxID=37001 RepID=A0A1A9W2H4_9MUSC
MSLTLAFVDAIPGKENLKIRIHIPVKHHTHVQTVVKKVPLPIPVPIKEHREKKKHHSESLEDDDFEGYDYSKKKRRNTPPYKNFFSVKAPLARERFYFYSYLEYIMMDPLGFPVAALFLRKIQLYIRTYTMASRLEHTLVEEKCFLLVLDFLYYWKRLTFQKCYRVSSSHLVICTKGEKLANCERKRV